MKIRTTFMLLCAAFITLSCQNEEESIQKNSEPMVIKAVAEGVTSTASRAEMAYKYDILWSTNDKIYVTDGTNNDSFTLQNGAGTTNGTFKQDNSVTFNGEVKAYYPSTLVQSGNLVWPATQTENPVVPMYSSKTLSGSTAEEFKFTSMGAILQIVFNTTRDDVTLKSVKIEDGEKTMSGTFSVNADGKATITATDHAGITLDLGTGKALGKGANYLNIAVPAGTYSNLKLTFTATDGGVCEMESTNSLTINQNTVGKLTLTGKAFKYNDSNLLPGLFSVSATKKVQFTKSNLYWDGSAFKFEANQTDYQTAWNANHVDHFYWTKTAAASYAKIYSDGTTASSDRFFADGKDAGHMLTVEGTSNLYVLSSSEWDYLRNNRPNANSKVKYPVTVGGKANCLIFAPDNFSGTLSSSYTLQQVNDNGFVCLPPAGVYDPGRTQTWSTIGNNGYVWSSTTHDNVNAFDLHFKPNDATYNGQVTNGSRQYPLSIRLVK